MPIRFATPVTAAICVLFLAAHPPGQGAAGLRWSTYLGGPDKDSIGAVATASNGDVVVAGTTESAGFPTTPGAYNETFQGTTDVFVARLSADGKQLVWSTLLGGAGGDRIGGIHVDSQDVITIAGTTSSTDFPATADAYRKSHAINAVNRGNDIFASRLSADGKTLIYSTYFGDGRNSTGSYPGFDVSYGVWYDEAKGWIYLNGTTYGFLFPVTSRAVSTVRTQESAFLSILDLTSSPGTTVLEYSTLLGDHVWTHLDKPHVDKNGVVTLSGSTRAAWPTTPNAFQTTRPNFISGWISRIDPSKSGSAGLVYSTYLGGASAELERLLTETDDAGVITAVGRTKANDFPVTSGAFQSASNGAMDVVVARLDTGKSGSAQLVYGSYVGGDRNDEPDAMHVNGSGVITISGFTEMTSIPLPTTPGAWQERGKGSGGFVMRLDSSKAGTAALLYSSFVQACRGFDMEAMHYDASADIATFVGSVRSQLLAGTTGSYQPQLNGGASVDGFVTKLDLAPLGPAVTELGAACPGSNGTPKLISDLPPETCLPYRLRVTGAPANETAILFIGLSDKQWGAFSLPLDLDFIGMTGCTLYTNDDWIYLMPTGAGTFTWGFTMPSLPGLTGVEFYTQVFLGDKNANRFGVIATNALTNLIRS